MQLHACISCLLISYKPEYIQIFVNSIFKQKINMYIYMFIYKEIQCFSPFSAFFINSCSHP